MKILHVASFSGNIGDNANHFGFRKMLGQYFQTEIEYTELEIREFYQLWNLRNFNSPEFIDCCNQHDLVVIGGGNFFELKWDYSYTGTTIDLSIETLENIKTPIFFNALGCDVEKGTSPETISKFKHFMDYITNSPRCFVSFRNDGSIATLTGLYGDRYNEKIHSVADGAFFFKGNNEKYNNFFDNKKFIGINIVSDMQDVRFKNIDYDHFIKEFARFIDELLGKYKNYQVMFFPHIYSDLRAINAVLEKIDNVNLRTRVMVAPYLIGEGSESFVFNMYSKCDLIIGMRFHTNVCAIARNLPTIGLSSYKKITYLYDELGLSDRVIDVDNQNYVEKLLNMIEATMSSLVDVRIRYENLNRELSLKNSEYFRGIVCWYEGLEKHKR